MYKERTKRWHDKRILNQEFKEGDLVLLFYSRLKLFPIKLWSRWSGPFVMKNVISYETIEVWSEPTGPFFVNGKRINQYASMDVAYIGACFEFLHS